MTSQGIIFRPGQSAPNKARTRGENRSKGLVSFCAVVAVVARSTPPPSARLATPPVSQPQVAQVAQVPQVPQVAQAAQAVQAVQAAQAAQAAQVLSQPHERMWEAEAVFSIRRQWTFLGSSP